MFLTRLNVLSVANLVTNHLIVPRESSLLRPILLSMRIMKIRMARVMKKSRITKSWDFLNIGIYGSEEGQFLMIHGVIMTPKGPMNDNC